MMFIDMIPPLKREERVRRRVWPAGTFIQADKAGNLWWNDHHDPAKWPMVATIGDLEAHDWEVIVIDRLDDEDK